jgi:hypothetical protein
MIVKKFDVRGIDATTFICVSESFGGDRIEISIHEQGKVTGIVSLDQEGWNDLTDTRYKLDIKDKNKEG